MLSGNSLRQTVHTHCACVHQAAKLVAALLRVAGVTAGLAESNGITGLWFTSPTGWQPRTGISPGTLRSVIECGLPLLSIFSTYSVVVLSTPAVSAPAISASRSSHAEQAYRCGQLTHTSFVPWWSVPLRWAHRSSLQKRLNRSWASLRVPECYPQNVPLSLGDLGFQLMHGFFGRTSWHL